MSHEPIFFLNSFPRCPITYSAMDAFSAIFIAGNRGMNIKTRRRLKKTVYFSATSSGTG